MPPSRTKTRRCVFLDHMGRMQNSTAGFGDEIAPGDPERRKRGKAALISSDPADSGDIERSRIGGVNGPAAADITRSRRAESLRENGEIRVHEPVTRLSMPPQCACRRTIFGIQLAASGGRRHEAKGGRISHPRAVGTLS